MVFTGILFNVYCTSVMILYIYFCCLNIISYSIHNSQVKGKLYMCVCVCVCVWERERERERESIRFSFRQKYLKLIRFEASTMKTRRTRSHPAENLLWKRLWTYFRTGYRKKWMNKWMTRTQIHSVVSRGTCCVSLMRLVFPSLWMWLVLFLTNFPRSHVLQNNFRYYWL